MLVVGLSRKLTQIIKNYRIRYAFATGSLHVQCSDHNNNNYECRIWIFPANTITDNDMLHMTYTDNNFMFLKKMFIACSLCIHEGEIAKYSNKIGIN